MNNSIETRITKLEQANNPPRLGKKVHFAAVHEGRDEQNADVMDDIAERESRGQRCILFKVISPKQRPVEPEKPVEVKPDVHVPSGDDFPSLDSEPVKIEPKKPTHNNFRVC